MPTLTTHCLAAVLTLLHAHTAITPPPPLPEAAPSASLPLYPTQTLEGFTLRIHPDLLAQPLAWDFVHRALRRDLAYIASILPAPALAALRERTPIWVSHEVTITPADAPPDAPIIRGRGAVFHWSADWPRDNGLGDGRGPAIDIYSAGDYLEWRDHQPLILLHELAHAYHALLGADRTEIREAFTAARASGRYDAVHHILQPHGPTRPAYAMTNEMEYFAELSEAYFGRNDFEPFTREELRTLDPEGFAMIEHLWSLPAAAIAAPRTGASQ